MDKPQKFEFSALLQREPDSSATFLIIPREIQSSFGVPGRIPVKGTIEGTSFRTTLAPYGGVHYLGVNRNLRESAGIKAGDTVFVVLERDDDPREIEIPQDLMDAFKENPGARIRWDKLSYSHRREYVDAILDARKPETRVNRIQKTIAALIKPYQKMA